MLIEKDNGTYTGGPLDVLCILHDVTTDKFHPAFFEEKPFPGPILGVTEADIVRLKSKMHHTEGFSTLPEALVGLDEFALKIEVPASNLWRYPREWDGELGIVWVLQNWVKMKGFEPNDSPEENELRSVAYAAGIVEDMVEDLGGE
jgi:hypothetical protein